MGSESDIGAGPRQSAGTPPSDVGGVKEIVALGYSAPTVAHEFDRLNDRATEAQHAALAAEVPVALVYNGRPHVVMMCTPADLEDFAFGFTITEDIASTREIARVDVVKYGRGIELQIEVGSGAADKLANRGRALVGRT